MANYVIFHINFLLTWHHKISAIFNIKLSKVADGKYYWRQLKRDGCYTAAVPLTDPRKLGEHI